jgi:DNA repair exonuclease SbcCD ATPase subunit
MSNKKSAKDIAFDKERDAYRKQIKELNRRIECRNLELSIFNDYINKLELKQYELQDWIDRRLEYIDIPKEDLEYLINREKMSSVYFSFRFVVIDAKKS